MPDKYLSLSVSLQVAFASGYIAYLIAYAGMRQHHTATDIFFRSLAFGLLASAVFALGIPISLLSLVLVGALPLGVAALWRWKGRHVFHAALRAANIKWADDIPTAWISVTAERTDLYLSQITVDVDGGRVLICDDTRRYSNAPFGPCKLGLDGSIAMYVTAECRPDGQWIESENIIDPEHGHRLTYLPASAVKRVELRYWSKASEKVAQAEEEPDVAAAGETGAAPNPECT